MANDDVVCLYFEISRVGYLFRVYLSCSAVSGVVAVMVRGGFIRLRRNRGLHDCPRCGSAYMFSVLYF